MHLFSLAVCAKPPSLSSAHLSARAAEKYFLVHLKGHRKRALSTEPSLFVSLHMA